jgi:nucleoid-associated protein YgaU
MSLTGRWFQLGTPDAGAEGQEVNSSDVKIEQVNEQKQTPVSFVLNSGASPTGFPEDTWILRIYEGDTLIKTSGFIVTRAAQTSAPTGSTGSTAPTGGTGSTAQPQNYTVVAGDTLQTVAQRFLPPGEQVQNFINRIATLNNIQPTATLTAGQVLRIPGPQ